MLDITLLQLMKRREDFDRLKGMAMGNLDQKTKTLISDFGKYFEKFPEHTVVNFKLFIPRFKAWHSNLTEDQFKLYLNIFKQVNQDADEDTRIGIVNDLYELNLGAKLAEILVQFEEGDLDIPLEAALNLQLELYKTSKIGCDIPWDETDIGDILEEDENNSGIKWRLDCLNRSMRPLREGDFGIIAGRPDTGKTSFFTSEVSFMAPQLEDGKQVIWLNNEGTAKNIRIRLHMSALQKDIHELVGMKRAKGIDYVRRKFYDAVGGKDRIKILDVHDINLYGVENVFRNSNPGIVVYDMIDNIKGFNNLARTDQALENMYQWARKQGVQYGFVGLAASQISVEGANMRYPKLSMLKDSKTGKQGACDFQLMIGSIDGPEFEQTRFLGTPKNKLYRGDGPKTTNAEVIFDAKKGIYKDIVIEKAVIESYVDDIKELTEPNDDNFLEL